MCNDCINKAIKDRYEHNQRVTKMIKEGLPLVTPEGPLGLIGHINFAQPCQHQGLNF